MNEGFRRRDWVLLALVVLGLLGYGVRSMCEFVENDFARTVDYYCSRPPHILPVGDRTYNCSVNWK